jgi:hypothetical protein
MAEDGGAIPTQQEGRSTVTSTTPESRRRVVTYEPSRRQTSGDLNAYRGLTSRQARTAGPGTPYMGDRS